jgi:hypothetical protein
MRREERDAAAARHLLQASAARVRKAVAVQERKGAAGAKVVAPAGAKGMAPAGSKGMAPTPPPPTGTAGPFESPSSFIGASTYISQFPSAAGVGSSPNGAYWGQGCGGSQNGRPWMHHQAFDPSTW